MHVDNDVVINNGISGSCSRSQGYDSVDVHAVNGSYIPSSHLSDFLTGFLSSLLARRFKRALSNGGPCHELSSAY